MTRLAPIMIIISVCLFPLYARAEEHGNKVPFMTMPHTSIYQTYGLSVEHERTKQIFKKLIRVLAVSQKKEISLTFTPNISFMAPPPVVVGGCFEIARTAGNNTLIFKTPEVYLPLRILLLDKKDETMATTSFAVAHELGHLEKIMKRPLLCEEYKKEYLLHPKKEELEADGAAVRLLHAAGYDETRIATSGIRNLCEKFSYYGCPISSPDHPSLPERINAIHNAASQYRNSGGTMNEGALEKLLREISFPLYVDEEERLFICTMFRVAPNRSNTEMFVASAGHCWDALRRELKKRETKKQAPTIQKWCKGRGLCWDILLGGNTLDAWENSIVILSRESPLDFIIFKKGASGAERYAPVIRGHLSRDETYYTLGMDEKGYRGLTKLRYARTQGYLFFLYIDGYKMIDTTSGAPIINNRGELVGVFIGYPTKQHKELIATDMRVAENLLKKIIHFQEGRQ